MIFFDWSGTLAISGTRDLFVSPVSSRQEKIQLLMPGAVKTLKELKNLGYRLGIISNTKTPRYQMVNGLNHAGILHIFDYQLYSSEAGVSSKPDASIFLQALTSNGLRPADAIYVGNDYIADVTGPYSIGMPSILISGKPHPYRDAKPILRITQLSEIVSYLRSIT